MRTLAFAGLALSFSVGCADAPHEAPPGSIDLRVAMGVANPTPVGIAIGPNGDRFVFDETRGLYRLDGDVAVEVVGMKKLPAAQVPIQLPITDIVALGPNQFAITAIEDGYLLDTSAMTLQQRFCYVPDSLPENLTQRTDAVAYDAAHDKLYAQPLTYDDQGEFQYAQIAGYDRATGADVEWHAVGNGKAGDVAATGMVVLPSVGLLLGQGSQLSKFDPASSTLLPVGDLARFGIESIDGLAYDANGKSLVIVDKQTDAVVTVELAALAL